MFVAVQQTCRQVVNASLGQSQCTQTHRHTDTQTHRHTTNIELKMLSGVTLDCQVTMFVINSGFQLAENLTSSQAMLCHCHGLCQCIWFYHSLCNFLLFGQKFLGVTI